MYDYWIVVATPDGTHYNGETSYVHMFTTKAHGNGAAARNNRDTLRQRFPECRVVLYRQKATYEQVPE